MLTVRFQGYDWVVLQSFPYEVLASLQSKARGMGSNGGLLLSRVRPTFAHLTCPRSDMQIKENLDGLTCFGPRNPKSSATTTAPADRTGPV